ncbi:MAG: hypothetical protein WC530_03265 [Candidatus Omnitrophota bacterium]|jgi:hypothetical protein
MKRLINLAVFAISYSVLIFETTLLRFFTFKMVSTRAFIIVSIAFLGIGMAGTYVYLINRQTQNKISFSFLGNFALAYSISIPLSVMFFAWLPFSPQPHHVFLDILFCLLYMTTFAIPFFLSGICISSILSLKEFNAGYILSFDLLGAGLGCISSVLFLRNLGGYGLLVLSILSAYLSALIFYRGAHCVVNKRRLLLPVILSACLLIFPIAMIHLYNFDIVSTNREEHHFKIFKKDFHGILATYWNPISRVDLSHEGSCDKYEYLFGLAEKYRNKKYIGRYILLDSGAATRQFRITDKAGDEEFLKHFLFSIPYRLDKGASNILIVGPGGGLEILIAKAFHTTHIDAVDINSDIINILRGNNKKDPLRNIYSDLTGSNDKTKIEYHVDEGRSFLFKNRADQYDIVQLTGVDLLSALMSGGMLLSESYLYTQEAFSCYYGALKNDGYIQVCYWGGPYALRLFVTFLKVLDEKGIVQPEQSLVALSDGTNFVNIIAKKGKFSSLELDRIRSICLEDNFQILFLAGRYFDPGERGYNADASLYTELCQKEKRKELFKNSLFNHRPTHDDKPFFYSIINTETGNKLKDYLTIFSQNKIVLVGIVFSFILIFLPYLLTYHKKRTYEKKSLNLLFYFGLIGLAFSLMEVTLIQKVSIFVGGPYYSMSVTLPAILIFYSCGAYVTSKIRLAKLRALMFTVFGIVLCGLFFYYFLDRIINIFFYFNHLQRMIFAALIVSLPSFLLGFQAPLGLEIIKMDDTKNALIPWAWGINSYGNVVGALIFAPLSQILGFNLLLVTTCFCYLIAFVALAVWRSRRGAY